MALKVEGVEGPTSTPQCVDGGGSRTRHPKVMHSKYGLKKRPQAHIKMTTVTDKKKSKHRDELLASQNTWKRHQSAFFQHKLSMMLCQFGISVFGH